MKNFKFIHLFLILLSGLPVYGQYDMPKLPKVADSLEFMIGDWEGSGWILGRDGKQSSNVVESVECKLDCTILVVEGLGLKLDSLTEEFKIVHEAFGVIFYDTENESISMRAYKDTGVVETEIKTLEPKVIQWQMDFPNNSSVRFTVDYTVEDEWNEIGEFSRDGENWTTYMGTQLKKVKTNQK